MTIPPPDPHDPVIARVLAELDCADAAERPVPAESLVRLEAKIFAADAVRRRLYGKPLHLSGPNVSCEADGRHNHTRGGHGTRAWWVPVALVSSAVAAVIIGGIARWNTTDTAEPTAARPSVQYVTGVGQRAVLRLIDGSRVTLAPQTRLRLDPGFGKTSRTVALNGEAYFEVAPGATAPFVVRTGTVDARVLGTAFAVRHYASDRDVRVAVVAGKVAVVARTPRRPSVTLTAGALGIVTDSSATIAPPGRTAPYTAWVDGRLIFHEAPTADVLAVLTRWYGYEFRLTDSSLARQNLTVGLSTQSSRAALATLKMALDVELSFEGTVVTLVPRKSGAGNTGGSRRDVKDIFSKRTSREVGR